MKRDANDIAREGGPDAVRRAFDAAHSDRDEGAPAKAAARRPRYLLDDRGKRLPVLANALTALRTNAKLESSFAFDEMLEATVLVSNLPGSNVPWTGRRILTDVDVGVVQEYLQRNGLARLSKDTAHQAVDIRAREKPFHPIRDQLGHLRWDGTSRVETWLTTYLGCPPSAYAAAVGRMFLVMMVARIFAPGCKADYMLVLEGPQGAHKSAACGILAGDWFSDSLPDVTGGKDVVQHLPGKWLIEVAELAAMSKGNAAALKAFVSRQTERYRPSYGRKEVVWPRQCVFVGTTNRPAYLRDDTGGRRFWPVKVGVVDLDALRRDRDQLFAEAVVLYHAGARWWPDAAFEQIQIRPEQEERFEYDAWEESIVVWLVKRERVLVGEVARDCLKIDTPRLGRSEQNRIVSILQRQGWRRLPKDGRGNIPWGPPPTTDNG